MTNDRNDTLIYFITKNLTYITQGDQDNGAIVKLGKSCAIRGLTKTKYSMSVMRYLEKGFF